MGNELFETVVAETELPDSPIRNELTELLVARGCDPQSLTLDQLRDVLADYLQTILVQAKDTYSTADAGGDLIA